MKNTGNVHGRIIAIQTPSEKIVITVVETDGEYPKKIPVKWVGKNIEKGSTLKMGQTVEIDVYISGNEWQGKYFADIVGYEIKSATGGGADHAAALKSAKTIDDLANAWRSIPKEERSKSLESVYKVRKDEIENPVENDDLPF